MELETPAADTRLMLDLGRVSMIAEVTINDKPAATLWAPPFRTDITPHLVSGMNTISVKVTNTWFNRLAYDAALPEARRKTWTIKAPAANSPLQSSGLLGPARIQLGHIVELPH